MTAELGDKLGDMPDKRIRCTKSRAFASAVTIAVQRWMEEEEGFDFLTRLT